MEKIELKIELIKEGKMFFGDEEMCKEVRNHKYFGILEEYCNNKNVNVFPFVDGDLCFTRDFCELNCWGDSLQFEDSGHNDMYLFVIDKEYIFDWEDVPQKIQKKLKNDTLLEIIDTLEINFERSFGEKYTYNTELDVFWQVKRR